MKRRVRKQQERKVIIAAAVVILLLVITLIGLFAASGSSDDDKKGSNQDPVVNENTEDVDDSEDIDSEDIENEDIENEDTENEDTENEDEMSEQEEQKEEILGDPVAIWTTDRVKLRQTPDTSQQELKVLSRGTKLEKYSEEDGWAYVKYGEVLGYVSVEYITTEEPKGNGKVVVIDPGHQLKGESTKEPNGPGSSTMKARVTSGTTGVATGVAEYILNLDISLKLRDELESRGYTIYMTREVHEVKISNMERAQYATTVGADIAVRIHANGSENSSVAGAETYVPSSSNPYISHLAGDSRRLGKCILDAYCNATGFKNRGVFDSDTMTGMNWSTVPVTIVEMGFMSNAEEDRKMQDPAMQEKMVQGIANGIDDYFGF